MNYSNRSRKDSVDERCLAKLSHVARLVTAIDVSAVHSPQYYVVFTQARTSMPNHTAMCEGPLLHLKIPLKMPPAGDNGQGALCPLLSDNIRCLCNSEFPILRCVHTGLYEHALELACCELEHLLHPSLHELRF